MPSRRALPRAVVLTSAMAAATFAEPPPALPRFLPDDPLAADDDRRDIPKPAEVQRSTIYDVIENTLSHRPSGPILPAPNVNTLGEVPDSSWFENRMGKRLLSKEELARGPDTLDGPDLSGPVDVIAAKSGGITPGFTVRDRRGEVFFVKFDPQAWPSLSTAADVLGSKFFHALGYLVPENYVAFLRRDQLRIAAGALVSVSGRKRPMAEADLDHDLAGAARETDGRIRIVASRKLPGHPLGPHEYRGTRGDDPNDVFPHEDRRDLRGLRVFCAWLNHDDSRSVNTQDTYVEEGGRRYVRHHLIDFSSILGAGSSPSREITAQNPRAGHEYIFELGPGLRSLVTLGLRERPWRRIRYRVHPEIGRIEGEAFRPEAWKPEYPNPAFERMQPSDAFWAARIVSRFSDEAVRAIVHQGRYQDPAAERFLVETLCRRRDKIVAHYFRGVNPLADFGVSGDRLAFRNLGREAGLAPVGGYAFQWFRYDNGAGAATPLGPTGEADGPSLAIPRDGSEYLMVRIRTRSEAEPGWARQVDVYLRGPAHRAVVGIERE